MSTLTPTPPVGRIAPSPSGRMHLGNVYAALMAWLSARSVGGRLLLRIEDLDARCADPTWTRLLLDDLRWLGLAWDGAVVYQHERLDLYEQALAELQGQGLVYPCFCTRAELHAASAPHASDGTPVYPGTCRELDPQEAARRSLERKPALRLRVPDEDDPAGRIAVSDRVFGTWSEVLARSCGDFVVRRSDGVFAYQLAVVVDDAQMGVSEVVRGRDLLGSCARQIYLQRLLGSPTPAYAHVPLLVDGSGRRLAKRDRDLDMGELRERFGRPEALLGWLAYRCGLAETAEPVSAGQLVEGFSWQRVREHRDDVVMERAVE